MLPNLSRYPGDGFAVGIYFICIVLSGWLFDRVIFDKLEIESLDDRVCSFDVAVRSYDDEGVGGQHS